MLCAVSEPAGPKKGGQVWEGKQMMGQPDKPQEGWEEWGMAGGRGEWGIIESFRMKNTSKINPTATPALPNPPQNHDNRGSRTLGGGRRGTTLLWSQ